MPQIFISPERDAAFVTPDEIRDLLLSRGLDCKIETHAGSPWIVLEDFDTALVLSVDARAHASSVVIEMSVEDSLNDSLLDSILQVFEGMSWEEPQDF